MYIVWITIAMTYSCAILSAHCMLNQTPVDDTNLALVDFELSIPPEERNDAGLNAGKLPWKFE